MTGESGPPISTTMLVDSHCHLDYPGLADRQDEVLDAARTRGVGRFLNISTRQDEWQAITATAGRHDDVFAAIGVHPHNADQHAHIGAAELLAAADQPRVVALGESGLDYHYDHSDRSRQRQNFRAHIAASRESGLPLVIHTRDAEADTETILSEELARGHFPALIHCFTGTPAFGRKMLELGLTISFSGIVTFKKADELRAFAAEVPDDRLLVETDAPFLAPVPHRGKTGEPGMVADTAEVLAQARGQSLDGFAETTTANFFRLFTQAC